jgi:phage major head subunit gpT-like protein
MLITPAILKDALSGYRDEFNGGFNEIEAVHPKIASPVISNTSKEFYGWLEQWPKLREWIGDRSLKNLSAKGYVLENKKFESSVSIPRTAIEDDQDGTYKPLFREMGHAAKVHPDELLFWLMSVGTVTQCYDGKNYFDTAHPVGSGTGSNYAGGVNDFWILLDTSRPLKPFIYQKRRDYALIGMDDDTDESVYTKDEYRFGVDGRCNVSFTFWQLAYGSRQPLNAANFNSAMANMMLFKSDEGRPLGIKPNMLICGPNNRVKALELLKADLLPTAAGTANESNPNKNAVELIITPYLP